MKKAVPYLLVGGGISAGVAAWLGMRKSTATVTALKDAVQGKVVNDDGDAVSPTFKARTTGYWPFTARDDEKKMEGGVNDRKGKPLHTLEDAQSGAAPFVSVSGDPDIFPYGQRLALAEWPGIVFRVVDTGSHFHGASKVYRMVGAEPLDICVASSKTKVPITTTATIVPGDTLDKDGKTVATGKFKDQTVAGVIEGRTSDDREALARAVESELGSRPLNEQVAAAWALRNRADGQKVSLQGLLAPEGRYGVRGASRGFVSTRQAATPQAYAVADAVLGADDDQDPTDGATDYWVPQLQVTLSLIHPGYGTVAEVRQRQADAGVQVMGCIGAVELLGKG